MNIAILLLDRAVLFSCGRIPTKAAVASSTVVGCVVDILYKRTIFGSFDSY